VSSIHPRALTFVAKFIGATARVCLDKDRVAGSAKKIKGAIKEVVGKAASDAKLEGEGKADKVEDKVQNAVGGLKDMLKSTASTRLWTFSAARQECRGYLRVQAPLRNQDLPSRAAREGAATRCPIR
jgi:uncharacterized protein YjbJ (UPF0337 family)